MQVISQNITIGENVYLDGEIGVSEFYDIMHTLKSLPKASCPSPDKFKNCYDDCEDDEKIVFALASKLS